MRGTCKYIENTKVLRENKTTQLHLKAKVLIQNAIMQLDVLKNVTNYESLIHANLAYRFVTNS